MSRDTLDLGVVRALNTSLQSVHNATTNPTDRPCQPIHLHFTSQKQRVIRYNVKGCCHSPSQRASLADSNMANAIRLNVTRHKNIVKSIANIVIACIIVIISSQSWRDSAHVTCTLFQCNGRRRHVNMRSHEQRPLLLIELLIN